MIHYKIPTHEYLEKIKIPITIFHGTDDWVVTYDNSKKLNHFPESKR
jgi:alpha-beta hydrolase superfamily lysophospholipase